MKITDLGAQATVTLASRPGDVIQWVARESLQVNDGVMTLAQVFFYAGSFSPGTAAYPTISLSAVGTVVTSGTTLDVGLWNISNNEQTGTTLTFTSQTPSDIQSAPIPVQNSPGNFRPGGKTYEVRARMTGAAQTNTGVVGYFGLYAEVP